MTKTIKHIGALCFGLLLLASCKHDHKPPSAELQEAYQIQQKALAVGKSIDEKFAALPEGIAARKEVWLQNMIEIPGMDHDHSNCNHDHHRATVSITDAEMLAVQKAWRDTILSIQNDIQLR